VAIAVSQGAKGRSGSTSSQATGAITTASGSTLATIFVWSSGTFSSIVDSKSNSWTQIGTEITFGTSGKARAYFSVLTSTGASHTVTAAQTGTSAMSIFVVEITGESATPFDKSANVKDTSSPFGSGVTATTTQANELIVGLLIGQTGSNPGTHALDSSSTPTSGWSITSAAEELDGTSFFTGAIASVRVTATGAYQGVWTESGSAEGEVFTATFKEAAAGAATASLLLLPGNLQGGGEMAALSGNFQ
jgi:hypothetical protein